LTSRTFFSQTFLSLKLIKVAAWVYEVLGAVITNELVLGEITRQDILEKLQATWCIEAYSDQNHSN